MQLSNLYFGTQKGFQNSTSRNSFVIVTQSLGLNINTFSDLFNTNLVRFDYIHADFVKVRFVISE